jgi:hypothetical protein
MKGKRIQKRKRKLSLRRWKLFGKLRFEFTVAEPLETYIRHLDWRSAAASSYPLNLAPVDDGSFAFSLVEYHERGGATKIKGEIRPIDAYLTLIYAEVEGTSQTLLMWLLLAGLAAVFVVLKISLGDITASEGLAVYGVVLLIAAFIVGRVAWEQWNFILLTRRMLE